MKRRLKYLLAVVIAVVATACINDVELQKSDIIHIDDQLPDFLQSVG